MLRCSSIACDSAALPTQRCFQTVLKEDKHVSMRSSPNRQQSPIPSGARSIRGLNTFHHSTQVAHERKELLSREFPLILALADDDYSSSSTGSISMIDASVGTELKWTLTSINHVLKTVSKFGEQIATVVHHRHFELQSCICLCRDVLLAVQPNSGSAIGSWYGTEVLQESLIQDACHQATQRI